MVTILGSQAKKVPISKLKVPKPIQDHIQASLFQERGSGCEEMDAKRKKSGGRGLEESKYAEGQTWRMQERWFVCNCLLQVGVIPENIGKYRKI